MSYQTFTQSQLKFFVNEGIATDISNDHTPRGHFRTIGVSHGTYGVNGKLLKSESGKLYVVIGRTGALFMY